MPRARKHLVCVEETPYYHVVSRCVRRAFLCGTDRYTGKSYEHRRGWIEDRLRVLASLFSIELCAYAVMSNHYHLVVKLKPQETESWSDTEVLNRWTSLFRGPLLVQQHQRDEHLTAAERDTLQSLVAIYRGRLASLSWFMKCLNEPIARKANAEDRCTGHFWEARFQSQALRSEQALIAAMVYVDLNPIRAGISPSPETSAYTSVSRRLDPAAESTQLAAAVSALLDSGELRHFPVPMRPLLGFSDVENPVSPAGEHGLPMQKVSYFELVDATGRLVVRGKRGRIDSQLAPILERMGLSTDQWIAASTDFRQHYRDGQLRSWGNT